MAKVSTELNVPVGDGLFGTAYDAATGAPGTGFPGFENGNPNAFLMWTGNTDLGTYELWATTANLPGTAPTDYQKIADIPAVLNGYVPLTIEALPNKPENATAALPFYKCAVKRILSGASTALKLSLCGFRV